MGHPVNGLYHDKEYGFPISNASELFERLVLEIFQAGLSWLIVLRKRQDLKNAFANFNVDLVAKFDDKDVERLAADKSIIRNRKKINATIENARKLIELRESHGCFAAWIHAHHPLTKDKWVKLFKKNFKFIGSEIVGEFLISIGYLPGAHAPECPIYQIIEDVKPAWKTS